MMTYKKPSSLSYLVIAFFGLTPFTWSYLAIVSGFLIRPIDVVAIGVLIVGFFQAKIIVNFVVRAYLILLVLLLTWLLINFVATNQTRALVAFLKIGFYGTVTVVVANMIVRENFFIEQRTMIKAVAIFSLGVLILNPQIMGLFSDLIYNAATKPATAVFLFWHELFKINLFGAEGNLEINGVSFRNTAALGFLAFAMLTYGIVQSGLAKSIFIPFMFVVVLVCMSRTAILCGAYWLLLIVAGSNNNKKPFLFLLIFAALLGLLQITFLTDTLENRFSGDLGGRTQMYIDGFVLISEKPIFGHGSEALVSHTTADRTIHNVVIALGAEYGLPAFFLAAGLILINIFSFFYFTMKWYKAPNSAVKQMYSIGATAAFVATSRPMLSASSENFYSFAEWACVAIILACYDPRLKERVMMRTRPKKGIVQNYEIGAPA